MACIVIVVGTGAVVVVNTAVVVVAAVLVVNDTVGCGVDVGLDVVVVVCAVVGMFEVSGVV